MAGADSGDGAQAMGHGRLCSRPGTHKTLHGTDTPPAGWPSRSQVDRDAVRDTTGGIRAMVMATARRRIGGVGGGGVDWSRDGPQDAQKNGMPKRQSAYWVMPPDRDAECVACMEEVLETYDKADDPPQPCGAWTSNRPWLQETRVPIAATPPHGTRVDDETNARPCAHFSFAEPLSGLRPATARARRTKVDWAIEVAQWLETRYVACAKGTLGCDNLHTHTQGAFDEAFPPERAGPLSRGWRSVTRRSTAVGCTSLHASYVVCAGNV